MNLLQKLGLPFDIAGGICFKNQAQFHPLKYMWGLCESIGLSKIYTNTVVTDVRHDDDIYYCYANGYKVKSRFVIMASHYPFINIPGFYFTKMYQSTSYLIAVNTKKTLFNGMFITSTSPTFSFRTAKFGNDNLLLIGGGDHKTGMYCDENSTYQVLENLAKTYYPDCDILYRWNTRDCITLDKIPFSAL